MKFEFEQIKEITTGAARIEREGNGVRFYRFTEKQEELYRKRSADYYMKSLATAGVRLSFLTNSKTLTLRGAVTKGSSRRYYSIDVFVNRRAVGFVDNFSDVSLPAAYAKIDLPLGSFGSEIELGGQEEKEVTIYLPWSVSARIDELSLDDGAYASPVLPKKTLLAFGDSITQGYDALRPSNRYTSRLCDALSAVELNKAIGGEVFWGELASEPDEIIPDYITVAYGTNDWNSTTRENMQKNCREFFCALRQNYPAAKIFALTPIWRKDYAEERRYGEFISAETDICEMTEGLNINIIRGFDLVPKDENYFADLKLHPNDKGFDHYFNNLIDEMNKKYLKYH